MTFIQIFFKFSLNYNVDHLKVRKIEKKNILKKKKIFPSIAITILFLEL